MTPYHNKSFNFRNFYLTVILTITVTFISGCDFIKDFLPIGDLAPSSMVGQETPTTVALITFFLQIPENTPADQPILISILDEVTGLALNPKRFKMEPTNDGRYIIGLPFPIGSTIKYRYSRQAEVTAEEHTTDGRAVRYRLYHVKAPGEVQDIVARWNDTNFDGYTGRISGKTTDLASGDLIPGLLVTAGGTQVISAGDGSFLIEGLPPGIHNLVAYAPNGSYQTYQHGAEVANESTTPAPVELTPTSNVDITFIVHIPKDTPPAVPIRLVGNLFQLGNTFADLSGGISTLASRSPILSLLPDGTYGVILSLPTGTDIKYKYSLGDGFWNTERGENGDWVVRQMIVPDEPVTIEENIETWHAGSSAPITFSITVPETTPPNDAIFIQFNPYGWTEPLPMWDLDANRWAYILYSPLDLMDELNYRYCRAGQCGQADDSRTPGPQTSGHVVQIAEDPKGISDQVEFWSWLESDSGSDEILSKFSYEGAPNGDFFAGVELQEQYHPSWVPLIPSTLDDIIDLGANWIFLTPSWTFSRLDPPVLESVIGQDPLWQDSIQIIRKAQNEHLNVALRPIAHFPGLVDDWWSSAPRDFSWWVSWFDRYETFALHHADLAERTGVNTLILGGDWMAPALPSGKLSDGNSSGVPPDANVRYRELITKVKDRFSGTIGWALSYPEDILNPPGFIKDVDCLYILWSEPLSKDANPSIKEMESKAERILTSDIYPMWLKSGIESKHKKVIISIAYPSVIGGTTECLEDPFIDCILPESLKYPAPDYPLLSLDLEIQAKAYHAMFGAISKFEWINGVVSRGYYPPTILLDKSSSIHGKPAEIVFTSWLLRLIE
jgi:hypothetical protein